MPATPRNMTIAARYAGNYAVVREDLEAAGAVWDDAEACFVFPDGSAGRFIDLRAGAAERYHDGTPTLRFEEREPLNSCLYCGCWPKGHDPRGLGPNVAACECWECLALSLAKEIKDLYAR